MLNRVWIIAIFLFQASGERITPLLGGQYPAHFIFPVCKVNDPLTIYFSPEKKQTEGNSVGAMRSNARPAGFR
jgi:hypothetical protein